MKVKIVLDVILLVLFAALCNTDITGVAFHEIVGCVYVVLIAAHLLLNRKWIAAAFKGKLKGRRAKIGLCVNIALSLCFWVIISTGGDISRYLFPAAEKAETNMIILHITFSIVAAFLVLVHVLLHFKIITKGKPPAKVALIIVLVATIGYSLFGGIQGAFHHGLPKYNGGEKGQYDNRVGNENYHKAKDGEKK